MKIPCPKCNTPIAAPDDASGMTVQCPACAHAFVAGAPAPQAARRPCPLCGASVAVGATKCPSCRGTIGTRTCPACREAAPVDAAVCPHCQTPLSASAPVVGSVATPQSMVYPANPPKSPTTAALLSFLICCIPFGHFYIGQTIKGLLWIGISVFTSGLGTIVATIDAYMCAKKLARGEPIGEFEFFPN